MEDSLRELLGEGPYPFPLDKIEDFSEYYESNGIMVLISRIDMLLTEEQGKHCHDSYEFLIPFIPMPFIGCEEKSYYVHNDFVFPINANQIHGPKGNMKKCCFVAIQINASLFKSVAYEAYNVKDYLFKNEVFHISIELKDHIRKFISELNKGVSRNSLIIDSLIKLIIIQLIRDYENRYDIQSEVGTSVAKKTISEAIHFIGDNVNNNEYSTKKAARVANLSDYHFIRSFKNETGYTPYQFLLDLKIQKAKELLEIKNLSVTEICFMCGFVNHSHFATSFKKRVGVSPSRYRKRII